MNKKTKKGLILLVVVLVAGYGISQGVISKSELEADARKSQKINENWQVSKEISDNVGAMIFYDESMEEYAYSIYLNKPGASIGYVYRDGGELDEITAGIAGFGYAGMGTALISMNKVNATRVELTKGEGQQPPLKSWELEAGKPFAIVIPPREDKADDIYLSIYDKDGKHLSSSNFVNGEL